MKVKILSLSAAAAAAALFVISCGGARSTASSDVPLSGTTAKSGNSVPALPVQTVVVSVGSLDATHEASGTVDSAVQSNVASKVGGIVIRTYRKAGDWVDRGDAVVGLDDTLLALAERNAQATLDNAKINLAVGEENSSAASPKLAAQLLSAQAALTSAQKTYDGQAALLKLGGATEASVDNAKSQLAQAQANVDAAEASLDQNKKSSTEDIQQLKLAIEEAETQLEQANYNLAGALVSAPFPGQIVAVNVQTGEYVAANGAVFVLASADRQVEFEVTPSDAQSFKVGSPIVFTFKGSDYDLAISQTPAAPVSGIVPVVAEGSAIDGLPFGAVGSVHYTLSLAFGAIVPIAAIQTTDNKNYIYSVDGGKAHEISVKIDAESGTSAVVGDIPGGTILVINPPAGLLDGTPVELHPATSAVRKGTPS